MTRTPYRILLVDDERSLNQLIATNLMLEGYSVEAAYSGAEALEKIPAFNPDLIILDVMMPGIDGYEVLRQVRQFSNVAVIMLTARSQVNEKIKGLSLGADDYLAKPFSLDELVARIAAVLRRLPSDNSARAVEETLAIGPLTCNVAAWTAAAAGTELQLQNLEFKLLASFMRAGDRVLTYDYLRSTLWDDAPDDLATLRVTVGKLRTKLKNALGCDVIATVHGLGYRLAVNKIQMKA